MKTDIYSKVFMWLFVGLMITFATGLIVSTDMNTVKTIFGKGGYFILLIAEFGVAVFLSVRIAKMKPITAKILYAIYSLLTGLTLSSIFIVYELSSIMYIFGITSALFLIFALIGKYTKLDLSKIGTYLFMMIIGVLICSIINIFVRSSMLSLGISIVSIIAFLGFIAYDIQRVLTLAEQIEEESLAVFCAFQLYIDFINIFIDLIRLFGDAKD